MTSAHASAETPEIFRHEHVTVIEPPRGWRMLDWRELWAYRQLLWVLAARDVQVRYKQATLGAAWAVLRPLATMVVFTVIFGHLAKVPSDGIPYPVFVFAALLPWSFFSSSVAACAGSLVGSSHLVSKVYFPRLVIPLAATGAPLVDLLVSAVVLLALMAWYGTPFTPSLLAAPLLLGLLAFASVGIGTLLSALTVAYRDFTHITPFLLQLWMYATPVVFPASLVPPQWQWVLNLNPMTGIIEGFRSAFLGRPFDTASLWFSAGIAAIVFAAGVAYFERVERGFADII